MKKFNAENLRSDFPELFDLCIEISKYCEKTTSSIFEIFRFGNEQEKKYMLSLLKSLRDLDLLIGLDKKIN